MLGVDRGGLGHQGTQLRGPGFGGRASGQQRRVDRLDLGMERSDLRDRAKQRLGLGVIEPGVREADHLVDAEMLEHGWVG